MAPSLPHARRDLGFGLWLLGITFLGGLLRFFRLGSQSLWIDEGMSLGWIGEIEARGFHSLVENIHGPLHALALYAASRGGDSEWWLRLPSAVAGTLAVPALAVLGRRLWGERTALTAAALCAVSPFALYYAQEVRNYAFTLLFAGLATLAAVDLARRPRPGAALRLAVAELLGILSNLNGLFFAFGLGTWLLVVLRRRRRGLALLLASQVLLAVSLLPYAPPVLRQVRPERLVGVEADLGSEAPLRGGTTLHPMSLPYTGYAFAVGYSLGPTLEELRRDPSAVVQWRHGLVVVLVLLAFGLPLVAALRRRTSVAAAAVLVVPALVVAACTLWLAAANVKPFNARYLSVLQPAFVLLVAHGLWQLPRRWRRGAGGLLLALSLWSCFNYMFVPRYGRDDTRSVVNYLLEHAGAEDVVLHINLGFSLRYYDRLPQRVHLAAPGSGDSAAAAEQYLETILGNAPTLWYLECRPEQLDPSGHLLAACRARAATKSTRAFVGIRLHRFGLRPVDGAAGGLER